jgi:hypothetical protein
MAIRWDGRTPGEKEYKRALARSTHRVYAKNLTDREKAILKDNIHVAEARKDKEEADALASAHTIVDQLDPEEEYLQMDWHREDRLQIDAKHATEEALEFWRVKYSSKLAGKGGKRSADGPSPSKPSGSKLPLRNVKKSKSGGKKV